MDDHRHLSELLERCQILGKRFPEEENIDCLFGEAQKSTRKRKGI